MHPLSHRLKTLLIRNTGEVLQHLQQVYVKNAEMYNEVILLANRHLALGRNMRKGTINTADAGVELRQINDATLALIDAITSEEAEAYELENAIFNRILVVCKSADREEAMRELFQEQYFKSIEFDVSEKPRRTESTNRFDLIVFDNLPPDSKEGPNELLLHYLDHTTPYLLYFGEPLPLLYKYPQKAYFANSIFSLHARLEEMIKYLKYTNRFHQT